MSTKNDGGHFSDNGQPSTLSNIGWKMMQKMGYVSGSGLGKFEHGRLEPVIPKQAPKKVSLDNFTKLSDEFEKRKLNLQKSLDKKGAKFPILKILNFLRKNHVIGEISRRNLTKLDEIFRENPPNLHKLIGSKNQIIKIPGLIKPLGVNYIDNLINYLINEKFIKKINEKFRRKLIESEEKVREKSPSKSPIFVPEYESDCEILLDKSLLPVVEPEIVTIKDDDDDDLIIDQNKWTSDNFQEIDAGSVNFDHTEKSIIDIPSTSSCDSDHDQKIDKLNIFLIRNLNSKNNQFEPITQDQFLILKNFFNENFTENFLQKSNNLIIPKIDRFDLISKFCILIVCSNSSANFDWLSKTIDKGAELFIDRNFRPRISIVEKNQDDNEKTGHPVAILIPDCGKIGSKLAIKYLNIQNPDLGIADFWRFSGELSIDDQFSSLFFIIDRYRFFCKLKNRYFRLHYRLGQIFAVANLSLDDVI